MKTKTLTFLFIFIINRLMACTGIVLVTSETVYYGGNEDYYPSYQAYVVIKPSTPTSYGIFGLGWDTFFMQTAVNEKGLCYDGFSCSYRPIIKNKNKPQYTGGNIVEYAMENCETVEQVMELFDKYYLPWMERAQMMFADRSGSSVIYEGDDIIYKSGDYQVCTNFYQSGGESPGYRYNTAISMLENSTKYNYDLVRDILDATHQNGVVSSRYSNIFDLKNGLVYLYKECNFDDVMVIELDEVLNSRSVSEKLENYFVITGIGELEETIPTDFNLFQNYPNPFNPFTTIEFELQASTDIRLDIFNALGRKVKTLIDQAVNSGRHSMTWNGHDDQGNSVSSGIYLCVLQNRQKRICVKMNLMK